MNRTTWLQDRRMQKFRDVLSRWERKELSAMEAGELLGCSERQFRRYRQRYDEDGLEGLVDKRLGRASEKRVPVDEIAWMLDQYRRHHPGWTVKHFHEHLQERHSFRWGYTWTKTQLHAAGLVERAKRRGAHRRKRPRKPCIGMMLHQDGSRFAWLAGQADPRSDRDDGRRHERDLFGLSGGGGRHGLELSRACGCVHHARLASEPLYRSRQPLLLHPAGRRGGRQGPAHPARAGAQAAWHRAHSGLLATGAWALGAHVRHAAGSLAQGAQTGRHPRYWRRQPVPPRGVRPGAQCALHQACGPARERVRAGERRNIPARHPLCPGATDRRPRQHRELQPAQAAAAGKSVAPPLCQGARDRSRISGRHTRNLPWTAVYRPLRRRRPGDRRPDPAQPGLVLAAVKAWPGRTGARRTRGATASLDRVSTPGQQQATGRDEETGFQVEQRNWTPLGARSALTNTENGAEGHSASPRPATTKSGQMMCYENRTTSKATDTAASDAVIIQCSRCE